MNLKNYQRETLDVLRRYFEATQFKSPEAAYAEVANTRDIRLRLGRDYGYANPTGLEGVPTVCIKVPTGGGKTILATHALKLIAAAQGRDFPLVLWFAPSDAIRRQTTEALKRPTHPYRRELDAAFGGHVRVFDLDSARSSRRKTSRGISALSSRRRRRSSTRRRTGTTSIGTARTSSGISATFRWNPAWSRRTTTRRSRSSRSRTSSCTIIRS